MSIKKLYLFFIILIALTLVASLAGQALAQPPEKIKVLVLFSEKPGPGGKQLVESIGGSVGHSFHIVPAVSATIPRSALNSLRASPGVVSIEEDSRVKMAAEVLPWGVNKINAPVVHTFNKGAGVKIAIVDTGIDIDHPDLHVVGGIHYFGGGSGENNIYDDNNGHGTHVAGIAAALDNDIGVIGVAPEASLYAVKVLDANGDGYASDLIKGIEWAVDNGMQVINLSIVVSAGSSLLEDACNAALLSGSVLVGAAGNSGNASGSGDTVAYPARYASVIAIAATDSSDTRWSSSGTGPAVELSAPGVNIDSTCAGGTYCTKLGTSMATAHVSGTAALVIASGIPDLNSNGRTNDEVRQRLQDTALDLGPTGRDTLYGYGRIDASEAVTPPDNWPPVANAGPDQTVSDVDGNGVESITLDGSASYDIDGSVVNWVWNKGTTYLGSGETLTTDFAVGSHTVTLTVTDNEGATNSDTVNITVNYVSTTTVSVSATAAWACDTGVDVSAGQILYITATGTWSGGTWTGDANGDEPLGGEFIMPGANAYALIGKIGYSGEPFLVGADYSGQVPVSGRLYLGMNDETDGFEDNSGSLDVVIGVEDPPPTPTPTPPGEGGGGCFIATSAFGSYLDGSVESLRTFRDSYLSSNPAGKGFVAAYYRLSPVVARFIDDHPTLKPAVRAGLIPAVAVSTVAVSTTLSEKIAISAPLMLVSVVLVLWMRKRSIKAHYFPEA